MRRLAFLLLLASSTAYAGRRPFLFASDLPQVPEGDVEIESWLDYIDQSSAQTPDLWRWWLGPRWSPADRFEVTILTVLQRVTENVGNFKDATNLWAVLLESRARALDTGAGSLFLQLDVRIAAQPFPHQVSPQAGWILRRGRGVVSLQAGYARGFGGPMGNDDYDWITWKGGVAYDVVPGDIAPRLQLGVESYGEYVASGRNDVTSSHRSIATAGPTVSVARGRLWLAVGTLFGLGNENPDVLVRGVIGLSL